MANNDDYPFNTVSILLGNGNGIFQNVTKFLTGHNPSSVTTDDFNNDNKVDLTMAN